MRNGSGAASPHYDQADVAALRDSLHQALADLARAERATEIAQVELGVAREQLKMMRRSWVWRLTAPGRRLRRRLTRGDRW